MAFCRNCGQPVDSTAAICVKCGCAVGQGQSYCPNCGIAATAGAAFCSSCGFSLQAVSIESPVPKTNLFCRNCGKPMDPNAAVCMACGFAKGTGQKYCANCRSETNMGAAVCTKCGCPLKDGGITPDKEQKSKMTAGLLGIFLGGFGVHQFYLEKIMFAVIHLGLAVLGLMLLCFGGIGLFLLIPNWIWGLVEGILILTGYTKTDGKGNPLKD